MEIGQVRNIKDVQWLMGCLMALSHFMSQLRERGLPLYKLLKKSLTPSVDGRDVEGG
jgi:hypothetical protein